MTPQRSAAVPALDYLERHRNGGTRSYSAHAAYTECRPEYRPDHPSSSFELPTWVMPRESLSVYSADPPTALQSRVVAEGGVRFHIHPQVLAQCLDDPYRRRTLDLGRRLPPLLVSPTASTRTLRVIDDGPEYALKVHFPFRVSRYGRRMRNEVIEQAVAVSRLVQRWCAPAAVASSAPAAGPRDDFAFLREVIGVSHPPHDDDHAGQSNDVPDRGEQWGYLVRDMSPYPPRPDPGDGRSGGLVPGFALYGRDAFDPLAPPLLFSLADPLDPVEWIVERIMLPVIRHWIDAYRELGLILEPHGQNLLLDVDAGGRVTRLVHRDLSVGIDMRIRRSRGLSDDGLNGYNRFEDGAFASIAYDRFIGNHFFGPLLEQGLGAADEGRLQAIRETCRDAFEAWFPDHADWLPPTEHYFSEVRDAHGKPLYHDTGIAPRWRP